MPSPYENCYYIMCYKVPASVFAMAPNDITCTHSEAEQLLKHQRLSSDVIRLRVLAKTIKGRRESALQSVCVCVRHCCQGDTSICFVVRQVGVKHRSTRGTETHWNIMKTPLKLGGLSSC